MTKGRPDPILETDRLILRRLSPDDDAQFIFELVNDPDWIRYIGERNVRSLDDARRYILNGPVAMYEKFGFGLWRTELKESGLPIGICGLIRRDNLDDIDVGFAFLRDHRAKGYAYEAAAATLQYGQNVLGLKRIVAITTPDNAISGRLLERLGLHYERMIRLGEDELRLFATE